ncbi:MAG: DUF5103 domain-containing protein [Porphyromonadaceae bacterium]|nr:DUF5103 domain-containing protein [Porphyromonadaceae bacterium]
MQRFFLFFVVCFASCLTLVAEPYRTEPFDSRVHTLQVRLADNLFAPPVIGLKGEDGGIVISFDMWEDDPQYLYYRVVHCNAEWTPSSLAEVEYLDGFNDRPVDDYSFSFNTYRQYVHYQISLPNEDVHFRLSGNYTVLVYPEGNPDEVLLTACFSLTEGLVAIVGEVATRTDVDYNKAHQQISFKVMYPQYDIRNPREEVKVRVNTNADNTGGVLLDQPMYVKNRELEYTHMSPLIFPAGNEYRRFEIVSRHYNTIGVEQMRYFDPYYHAVLHTDFPRVVTGYLYDETQKGRFFIRAEGSDDADTEADYFVVHFSLSTGQPVEGDIYIDGEFTYGHLDATTRMSYNPETKMYEKEMVLKQGSYNYRYLLQHPGKKAEAAPIEGNFYETLNEYQIYVYHRPQGTRYDRLVGYGRCGM